PPVGYAHNCVPTFGCANEAPAKQAERIANSILNFALIIKSFLKVLSKLKSYWRFKLVGPRSNLKQGCAVSHRCGIQQALNVRSVASAFRDAAKISGSNNVNGRAYISR